MKNSTFNPEQQQKDISSKIVAGLERVSEVFKVLLWEKAKQVGLSPIQIQILLFIAYHDKSLCNVSHLAKEFNVTKPTVSDAIRVLDKKGLIEKDFSPSDSRSYLIVLSEAGKEIIDQTYDFSDPLKSQIDDIDDTKRESLFATLSELIFKLNKADLLSVQRTCFGCRYFRRNESAGFCDLLQKTLAHKDIRLDCPEFEATA